MHLLNYEQAKEAYYAGKTVYLAKKRTNEGLALGSFDQWEGISIFDREYAADFKWRVERFCHLMSVKVRPFYGA